VANDSGTEVVLLRVMRMLLSSSDAEISGEGVSPSPGSVLAEGGSPSDNAIVGAALDKTGVAGANCRPPEKMLGARPEDDAREAGRSAGDAGAGE